MESHLLALSIGALVALKAGLGCSGDDDGYATGPTVSCYEIMDSGSGAICMSGATDQADAACRAAGSYSGSCPTKNVVGCCLETISVSAYGEPTVSATNATCYYSEEVAKSPMAKCTGVTSDGFALTWSKTP